MLWKKLFRELKENKGSYFAAVVIIAIGLMIFISFSMVVDNLRISQQAFYKSQNFADGFAEVQGIPFTKIKNLEGIDGIKEIQGRIVKDVRLVAPDREGNVYLRLISLDVGQENPINGMLLLGGIPLGQKDPHIWVDNMYFEANGQQLNDRLAIIAGGHKRELQIVGMGQSPEFIYALRTAADLFPDPEHFGIGFVSLDTMKSLFPQEGIYNDIVFTIEEGASFDSIKERLETELKPYGLIALYPRDDQLSHQLLTMELDTLESMAKALPIMFLFIAATILYIVLKRLTEQQRGQIGILKALGYTPREIIIHYLSYAMVIGLVGGAVGGLSGILLLQPMIGLFRTFFNMPGSAGGVGFNYLFIGMLLSLGFSLAAGYQGCKKVLALEPAEAMLPPGAPIGKKVLLERVKFIWHLLTVQGMIGIRNISRSKGRSLFIFTGILLCFAINSFTWSMNDLYRKMLFDQYEIVEVYDVKVILNKPLDGKGVTRELGGFPGVGKVEAMAEIPATLKNNWLQQDIVMMGIPMDSQLYNIIDEDYNRVSLPRTGIVLSQRLAELLQADIGTVLNIESLMAKDGEDKQMEVVEIIPQYVGMNAYLSLEAMGEMLGQGGLATSIMVNIDEENIDQFKEKYSQSDLVAGIDEKNERLKKMQEMMDTYGSMIFIYMIIGVVIGFAIIYIASTITVSERSRELASMMVLGMTTREVLSVITFEQWFIGIPAMIVGIPVAKLMLLGMAQAVKSDVFTMPVSISFSSFLVGGLITWGSIWVGQRAARVKISRLSLVEVLKARE